LTLFWVAVQFLTRLPTPRLNDFQTGWLSASARYFPAVGALVGAINVCIWWTASLWLPIPVAVGLMMAASLLMTGAFHEDGFADVCDGFGGGSTPESILAIMKDSRVGAYGAIGVAMILGLKWCTLAALPISLFPAIVAAAHMFSRWCATALICRLRYVRGDANSKSKPFAESLSGANWLLSGALGTAALLPMSLFLQPGDRTLTLPALGVAALASLVVMLIAAAYCRKRLGGYTGDCLGAVQQLTELAFLITSLGWLRAHG
jgi:adenosylcobinamide-GDP ribazoletransferase